MNNATASLFIKALTQSLQKAFTVKAIWPQHTVHTYFCQHLLPFCRLGGVWISLNQVEELLSELLVLLLLLLHVILEHLSAFINVMYNQVSTVKTRPQIGNQNRTQK